MQGDTTLGFRSHGTAVPWSSGVRSPESSCIHGGSNLTCHLPVCRWEVSDHYYWVYFLISVKSYFERLENQFWRGDLEYFSLWWELSSSLRLCTGRSASQIVLFLDSFKILLNGSWKHYNFFFTLYFSIDLDLQKKVAKIVPGVPLYYTASISLIWGETLQDTCFI